MYTQKMRTLLTVPRRMSRDEPSCLWKSFCTGASMHGTLTASVPKRENSIDVRVLPYHLYDRCGFSEVMLPYLLYNMRCGYTLNIRQAVYLRHYVSTDYFLSLPVASFYEDVR